MGRALRKSLEELHEYMSRPDVKLMLKKMFKDENRDMAFP